LAPFKGHVLFSAIFLLDDHELLVAFWNDDCQPLRVRDGAAHLRLHELRVLRLHFGLDQLVELQGLAPREAGGLLRELVELAEEVELTLGEGLLLRARRRLCGRVPRPGGVKVHREVVEVDVLRGVDVLLLVDHGAALAEGRVSVEAGGGDLEADAVEVGPVPRGDGAAVHGAVALECAPRHQGGDIHEADGPAELGLALLEHAGFYLNRARLVEQAGVPRENLIVPGPGPVLRGAVRGVFGAVLGGFRLFRRQRALSARLEKSRLSRCFDPLLGRLRRLQAPLLVQKPLRELDTAFEAPGSEEHRVLARVFWLFLAQAGG
jgi:hypothetical protein